TAYSDQAFAPEENTSSNLDKWVVSTFPPQVLEHLVILLSLRRRGVRRPFRPGAGPPAAVGPSQPSLAAHPQPEGTFGELMANRSNRLLSTATADATPTAHGAGCRRPE